MAVLIISTATESYSYELPTEVGAGYNIGSGADCQISVPGVAGLAELHCSITCMEDGYVITDAGTPSGTMAYDRKVESEYMSPEIVYTAGELTITLANEEPAVEAETTAAEGAAPAKKKTTKRTVTKKAAKGSALTLEELKAAAAQFDRSKNKASRTATLVYIIVVLLAAFYAGVALHHWQKTGNCLPGLMADPELPAEATAE